MAKLNTEVFNEKYKDVAPKECGMYLFECLSEEEKVKLKGYWEKVGGYKTIPWWKWCLDNIKVSY